MQPFTVLLMLDHLQILSGPKLCNQGMCRLLGMVIKVCDAIQSHFIEILSVQEGFNIIFLRRCKEKSGCGSPRF